MLTINLNLQYLCDSVSEAILPRPEQCVCNRNNTKSGEIEMRADLRN